MTKPKVDDQQEKEAVYIKVGRDAAKKFIEDDIATRPPPGVSYLTIARGYADLLMVSALYKLEKLLKTENGLTPELLLEVIHRISLLQVRVRGKTRTRAPTGKKGDKPDGVDVPTTPRPVVTEPLTVAKTASIDEELGLSEDEEEEEGPVDADGD